MPALQPQAALEQAVVNILRDQLGYAVGECDRCFDGQPPPRAGNYFVAVWSDGRRTTDRGRTMALDQRFRVSVTVTRRSQVPFDRKVQHRDDLEVRLNAITALVDRDSRDHAIIAAANVLAGYRSADRESAPPKNVGFVEALAWESTEIVRTVDGKWFWAQQAEKEAGVCQTAHFGRARHIQSQATSQ